MNSILKTRIYDYKFKKYINPEECPYYITPFGEVIIKSDCSDDNLNQSEKYVDASLLYRRYVIEKCTGILDNNGILIYEGDILRAIKGSNLFKVIWNGCFAEFRMVKLTDKDSDSYDKLYPKSLYFANRSHGKFEIVGNIHSEIKTK